MRSKAAILVRLRQPLIVAEVEVPPPGRGQVLLRMRAAGVCRSQISEIRGERGADRYLPHLLGHEGSAIVEEAGDGVTTVKKGDHVAVSWIRGQGINAPGGRYRWGRRRVNSGGAAVFAEAAVVSEDRGTRISQDVPPEVAAVIGCAVATGAGAVRHVLGVQPGSSLAVFGVGGVGGSAVLAAAALRCRHIICVDVSDKKLRWAKSLGATQTINAKRVDPVAKIMRLFPEGVDNSLEAAGQSRTGEQAFAVLGKEGTLAVAGHPKQGVTMCIEPFKLIEGRRVVGTWGGETKPERDFPYYQKAWRAGKLPIEKLITDRFTLADINRALDVLDQGNAGRIIIEF